MRAKFVKSGWKLPGVGRRGAWGGARLTGAWEWGVSLLTYLCRGVSSSGSITAQSRRQSASASGSLAARLQSGSRTRSRHESSPRAARLTTGGSRSRPQPQDSRVWGGGGKVQRGGRERGREAGEETSERGEGRNRGASACSDPVLLRAAAADVPGSQRSRETRKRWQKRSGLHGESQCIPTGRPPGAPEFHQSARHCKGAALPSLCALGQEEAQG